MDHVSIHKVNRRLKHTGKASEFCYNCNTLPWDNVEVSLGRLFPPLTPSLLLIGFTCNTVYDSTQLTSALSANNTFIFAHSANDQRDVLIMKSQVFWGITTAESRCLGDPCCLSREVYALQAQYCLHPEDGGEKAPSKRRSVLTNRHGSYSRRYASS